MKINENADSIPKRLVERGNSVTTECSNYKLHSVRMSIMLYVLRGRGFAVSSYDSERTTLIELAVYRPNTVYIPPF